MQHSSKDVRSGDNLPETSGLLYSGLFLLEAPPGFASDYTHSNQDDADSCATYLQELAIRARAPDALDDAPIEAPPAS